MPRKDVERKKVRISVIPPPDSSIKHVDNVYIVVTEAFCPNGHNLIHPGNEDFDGWPGISLLVRNEEKSGILYISPFHGDSTKKGMTDWKAGERLMICCPECGVKLPRLAGCHCSPDSPANGDLLKLFTTPALTDSHIMAFCNVWGCRRSRTIDDWNLISEYFCGEVTD